VLDKLCITNGVVIERFVVLGLMTCIVQVLCCQDMPILSVCLDKARRSSLLVQWAISIGV
jgi:hypothetical protein